MEKYKFTVSLEQITPYVNELGEKNEIFDILRPTEFKPRFDKFLLKKYMSSISEFKERKIIKKNKDKEINAFNYKLTIISDEEFRDDYTKAKEIATFKTSGNLYRAREKEVKLKLQFFSFQKDLIKIIKENIAEFLAVTNFGKRKSKGYGSFYIDKEDPSYVDIDALKVLQKNEFFNTPNKHYYELKSKRIQDIFIEEKEKNKSSELEDILENKRKKPFIIFRYLKSKETNSSEIKSKLTRIKTGRNESLGAMKILKKYECSGQDFKYRLYYIPNDELIEAYKEKNEDIEKQLLNIFVKKVGGKEIFNKENFLSYIAKF